mmetsp:Transcript_6517/g.10471  ORF Transcript_6517/g.10471 Transcript_6517/m.10471 type:complete len:102 (+) Transcript_6517:14-319(+)
MIKNNKGQRKTTSKVVSALLLGTAIFGQQASATQSMAAVRSSLQSNLRNYLHPHQQNQAVNLAQISESTGLDLNSFTSTEAPALVEADPGPGGVNATGEQQ